MSIDGGTKSSLNLYLKIELDGIDKYTTYAEKNAGDIVEWHSSFSAVVQYPSLNELKTKDLTVVLYEKKKGLFEKDVALGGLKVDFLTLATVSVPFPQITHAHYHVLHILHPPCLMIHVLLH